MNHKAASVELIIISGHLGINIIQVFKIDERIYN